MSEAIAPGCDCPDSAEALERQIHQQVEQITAWCQTCQRPFWDFEKELFARLRFLGCLFVSLFLLAQHQRLDLKAWLGAHRLVDAWAPRRLKTVYGTIRYARAYLARRRGRGGFHPLDAVLGLTRDTFSPGVISLATRLTTRLSYKTAEVVLTAFWGWSPSTEALEHLVLGMGRLAPMYMSSAPPFPEEEGEILVIEVDGKAAPMVRATEMLKRRGPRQHGQGCACGCQRHRGRSRRQRRGPKKPRKKWARDKNGRSATLVVMYTLRRGADGLLHGPINKRVWGSFAKRKVMLRWARAEATRRGFHPDTTKRIQVLLDGERCLALGLKKLFPQAQLTLDIRHVEEKLWQAGRAFHAEGSTELAAWVKELRTLLYEQGGPALMQGLRERLEPVPKHGPGTKQKRQGLSELITYAEKRLDLMAYPQRLAEDMPVATGNVEGAVRHVIGQRLDCSGMRWVVGKAEAMLRLRCIEVNGQWDDFFAWCQQHWRAQLQRKKPLLIRTEQAIPLPEAA
jgi:hypothetical protein